MNSWNFNTSYYGSDRNAKSMLMTIEYTTATSRRGQAHMDHLLWISVFFGHMGHICLLAFRP